MRKEKKSVLRNKLIQGMTRIFICGTCLFSLTACEKKVETERSYEQAKIPVTQEPAAPDSENVQEAAPPDIAVTDIPAKSLISMEGKTILERFDVPQGFTRAKSEEGAFACYLQNLPLKEAGAKVKYYDGREKQKNVYLAVVDFSLGERDLQQCADAVIRLRAEYLYSVERYEDINFNFVSGFQAQFSKWAAGNGISVNGNQVSWSTNSKNNSSYESFQKYLDIVYAYASTLSLEKELKEKPFSDLAIGDVFIQGGAPGHCVIVVDMAVKEQTGEKIFMLAQSYMPAQDIQILKGDKDDSPWFSANIEETLNTPEWTFQVLDLRTW